MTCSSIPTTDLPVRFISKALNSSFRSLLPSLKNFVSTASHLDTGGYEFGFRVTTTPLARGLGEWLCPSLSQNYAGTVLPVAQICSVPRRNFL